MRCPRTNAFMVIVRKGYNHSEAVSTPDDIAADSLSAVDLTFGDWFPYLGGLLTFVKGIPQRVDAGHVERFLMELAEGNPRLAKQR